MARNQHDREDLLGEATALVERVELTTAGRSESIVLGFRRDQSASFFFGGDPVYQFNSTGELRRAFRDNLLYKAEAGYLVSLKRHRSGNATHLLRRTLSEQEQSQFLTEMRRQLLGLLQAVQTEQVEIVGQVPDGADVIGRVARILPDVAHATVAENPHAG
ncbi:MAG: hypothetical protein VX988_02910 [Planctomycetota bacterium]|nr:hypothetical protein [Planctomycetota bacterium]MEE3220635.1 hypothetical protein [Planctomycetota bacterium]